MSASSQETPRAIGIQGRCEPQFAAVRTAFETNLRLGDDLGASIAVYLHGKPVVDLSGGRTIDGADYDAATLQLLYSVSKAVTTICLMQLVEDGRVRLDARVADCWPEFAANGKAAVTLRDLLSHKAGLIGFDVPVDFDWLADWSQTVAQLAAQAPAWPLGSGHGYHALTFGFLAGEVIRRVTGQSVGTRLREQFAEPLGLDLHIGLPPSLQRRVTPHVDAPGGYGTGAMLTTALETAGSHAFHAFSNPPIDTAVYNDPITWRAEIPGVNCIGNARSLATLFATLTDGALSRFGRATIDDFRREASAGPDFVLVEQPTRFGAGFMLACPREPMLGPGSFGHNGRGGALAFADPETGIAFAYVGNRLVHDPTPHTRLWRLLAAVRYSL